MTKKIIDNYINNLNNYKKFKIKKYFLYKKENLERLNRKLKNNFKRK